MKLIDALDRVGAAGGAALDDDVAGIVDDIGVVAETAVHRVRAAAAIEPVGAAIADEDVAEAVAGAVDIGGPGQGQVLDCGSQRVADRAFDLVGALAGQLGDSVGDIVDDIDVIAKAALHDVGAEPAVETVGGVVAGEGVGARIAEAVDRRRASQDEVLDLGGDLVGDRGCSPYRCRRRPPR